MRAASYKFTVDQYLRMAQAGIFPDEPSLELIDGEILVMLPCGPELEIRADDLLG